MTRKFDKFNKDAEASTSEVVSTNQPTGRFSTSKEVLSTEKLGATSSSIPGSATGATTSSVADAAKKVKSKMKLAPDVSVTELEGKQVGGVPLAGSTVSNSVAGFSSASTVDDTSKTPYTEGGYRPSTRDGKKRSDILFEMDNTISEQIVPEVDDAKDLAEAPDAKQGYNGRKQFKSVRSKKNFTFTNGDNTTVARLPQQLLNECSVDFVTSNKTVYTSGQMIDYKTTTGKNRAGKSVGWTEAIDIQADYPTVANQRGDEDSIATILKPMHKGNYKPKALVIKTKDGYIDSIDIQEDQYHVVADPITREEANLNWQLDANNIAKSTIKLQTELGRETTDKWSPLGYVINQPYQYNMLMHDIEATTGSIAAAAYRAAVSSLAFQRNILAKDGVNPQRNAVKMILEGYAGVLNSNGVYEMPNNFRNAIWQQSEYQKGSIAGLIKMFDSVDKYRTKADILGMQRSLTMHLAQANNNLSVLRCKPEFLKAMDKAHLFSTPSGLYNPMLPIYNTGKIDLILPLSLKYFLKDWKNPIKFTDDDKADAMRDQITGTLSSYCYAYRDVRNLYAQRVQHPLVEGLVKWLLDHEGAFVNTFGDDATITLPIEFNLTAPNLFDFIVCAALQDVVFERNIVFRDVLFAGEQSTYIWDDLVDLKSNSPLASTQLNIVGYNAPLKLGKMAPDAIIREFWGTHWDVANYEEDDNHTQFNSIEYFAPWYFNEKQFGTTAGGSYTANEGFKNENTAFNMTIPSIRDGVRHEYVDYIKNMEDRDIRLALDRQLDLLHFTESEGSDADGYVYTPVCRSSSTLEADNNDDIIINALRYEANSDGRVIVKYKNTSKVNSSIDRAAIYCIPKEIGYIEDMYEPYNIITLVTADSKGVVVTTSTVTGVRKSGNSNDKYVYDGAKSYYITSYKVADDGNSLGSINRSAALTQVFYRYFATPTLSYINTMFIDAIGISPSITISDEYTMTAPAVYNLDSVKVSKNSLTTNITTIAPRIWTMVQRFFYPVNPFENGAAGSSDYIVDPLETSFYFGVCGTLASDYTQDILERLDAHDQLGPDYTEDVFMRDSALFR